MHSSLIVHRWCAGELLRSLFIASVLAGMLLCIPAPALTDSIRGKILKIDDANSRLMLMRAATTTPISVTYDAATALCGHGKGLQTGCCIRPGNTVEIEGAFSTSDATLFSATAIRGHNGGRRHDPTGARARLQSCTQRVFDSQEP